MNLYKWLLIAAFLVQPFASCNKDNTKLNSTQALSGTWELRSWYGGYSATGGGTVPPGNGDLKQFAGNEYWFASEGRVWDSGTYKLTRGLNPDTNNEMDALLFKKDTIAPVFFYISNDTLTIYNGSVAWDGTVQKYVRIATPEYLLRNRD